MNNTRLLSVIREVLKKDHKPFSVPEMKDVLAKKNIIPNKTTLYRIFEKLVKSGEVEELLLDLKTTYYELRTSHHHHHFRCHRCNKISCIEDYKLESQIHFLEKKLEEKGLQIENHHFFLTGKCSSCS